MTAAAPRALLVNGNNLASFTGMIVTALELFIPATRRGSPDDIPGRAGSLGAELPYASYSFAAAVTLEGSTESDFIANLASVSAVLAGTNGLVNLTRRLPTDAVGGYVDHTAKGQFFGGLGFNLLNLQTGQTELQFVNLDGRWSPDGGSTWLTY